MLIQSSLFLLALAQGSAAETPVENPPVETPKKVQVKLIPEQGFCDSTYKAEFDESGALHVGFDDLISEPKPNKYRAACRLGGELIIPRGYKLDPAATVSGLVKGVPHGDAFTGRLTFDLDRYIARDFQVAENNGSAQVKLHLKAAVPQVPLNCEKDVTWLASLFIETTINGGAHAQIEYLKLDPLILVAGECPPSTHEPTPVPSTLTKP